MQKILVVCPIITASKHLNEFTIVLGARGVGGGTQNLMRGWNVGSIRSVTMFSSIAVGCVTGLHDQAD